MPATPMVLRASFTSSSLKGLRTATTSFMCSVRFRPCSIRSSGSYGRGGRRRRGRWRRGSEVPHTDPRNGEVTDPLGELLLGVDLLVVDGEGARLQHLVLLPQALTD